jgi:hypothetical protein
VTIQPENYPQLRAPLLTTIRVSFVIFTVLCVVGIAASLVGPRQADTPPS